MRNAFSWYCGLSSLILIWLYSTVAIKSSYGLQKKRIKVETRIYGGVPVSMKKFPWSVKFFNSGNMCAGSILNSWTVLTAAHCMEFHKDVDEMIIQAGARYMFDTSAEFYDVITYVIHPDYGKVMHFSCDIAILFVSDPIQFSSKTKKAILVNTNKWMREGEVIDVNGWGQVTYNGSISQVGLQWTQLRYVRRRRCEKMHNRNLSNDMFCMYGDTKHDACKGDSGGGVVWKGMLVGIVSHGYRCAEPHSPSIYANIFYFRKWIEEVVTKFISTCDVVN